MVSVFRGQDAVVLCLAHSVVDREVVLVKASIEAGVERTIVNGYGSNDENPEVRVVFPIAREKAQVLDEVKTLAKTAPATWSWTSVCIGLFFDKLLTPTMGGGRFFGLDPAERAARTMGDGNFKFSTTNVATVGTAVSRVLSHPEETANRSVYISSFEVSLNELLAAYQKATGKEDWTVTHVDVDDEIEAAQEKLKHLKATTGEEVTMEGLMATAKLGMAIELKNNFGPNLAKLGKLDNELLGLLPESVEDTVAAVLKDGLKL